VALSAIARRRGQPTVVRALVFVPVYFPPQIGPSAKGPGRMTPLIGRLQGGAPTAAQAMEARE
jgi:hypothetical protein